MNDKVTKLPAQPGKISISFQLGDTLIDSAVVRPLSFGAFTDCISEARALKQPTAWEARMRRVRMVRQVAYYAGTNQVSVSMEDVLKLPIPAVRELIAKLDEDTSQPGKIIREGDGIEQAIVYELGTPIPMGQGKQPIKELEFLAKTYGDIEDVLAAPDTMNQTAVLVSTLGKPLGTSLTALPSRACR